MPLQTFLIPSNSQGENSISEDNDCDEESILASRNMRVMVATMVQIKSLAHYANVMLTSLSNKLTDTVNRIENITLRSQNIALQLKYDLNSKLFSSTRQTESSDMAHSTNDFTIASVTDIIAREVGSPHDHIVQRYRELSTSSTLFNDLISLLIESNSLLIYDNCTDNNAPATSSLSILMLSSNPCQFDPYYLSTHWMSVRKKILESDSKCALWITRRKARRLRFTNESKEFKRRVQLARDSVTSPTIHGQLVKIKSMRDRLV